MRNHRTNAKYSCNVDVGTGSERNVRGLGKALEATLSRCNGVGSRLCEGPKIEYLPELWFVKNTAL
jgi:hypothetical protein